MKKKKKNTPEEHPPEKEGEKMGNTLGKVRKTRAAKHLFL